MIAASLTGVVLALETVCQLLCRISELKGSLQAPPTLTKPGAGAFLLLLCVALTSTHPPPHPRPCPDQPNPQGQELYKGEGRKHIWSWAGITRGFQPLSLECFCCLTLCDLVLASSPSASPLTCFAYLTPPRHYVGKFKVHPLLSQNS